MRRSEFVRGAGIEHHLFRFSHDPSHVIHAVTEAPSYERPPSREGIRASYSPTSVHHGPITLGRKFCFGLQSSSEASYESQSQPMARTQLPYGYWPRAGTVQTQQGLTLPRIRLGLGRKVFFCALTFFALSRLKSLKGLFFIQKLYRDSGTNEEAGRKILAVAIRRRTV